MSPVAAPLRVRAFYTRYPHWGAHAGIHQLCRYFDPAEVDVALRGVPDNDDDWWRWCPLPVVNSRLRAFVQRRGMAYYKLSDLAAELHTWPGAFSGTIDVVHYLDAEHGVTFLPRWIAARRRRAVTVGTFHQPPALLRELVSQKVAATLDMVLVVSPTQEAFFRECLPPERVRSILHGVDADFFRPADGPREAGRPFRCITAGHWLRDWTAVRAVVERFQGDRHVEFHVVTNRDTGLAGFDNVVVHVDVDDESLRRLYQEADALLLPLIDATANNCLLEGLASGLPVVSSDIPSVATYLGGTPARLVAGNDPAALADAVRELRDDEPLRSRMGAASRARAEELAWSRVAPAIAEVYHELVAGRTRPHRPA